MTSSKPIILYDIASGPPRRTFAPSPWKSRYALNFKGVHYETSWVEFPDVKSTRMALGAAPNRLLPDGSDFYTLPVIKDQSNDDKIVGDTFDIAMYLDERYPDGPRLIPPGSIGVTAAFDAQINALFTVHAGLLAEGMPFNPAIEAESKQVFKDRHGLEWEQMAVTGEAKAKIWMSLKTALADLSKAWKYCGGGPFLNGPEATYADFIVGAWIHALRETSNKEEWAEFCSWQDGFWGRFHQALQKYATIK